MRILKGWSGKIRNEEDEQPEVEEGEEMRGRFVKGGKRSQWGRGCASSGGEVSRRREKRSVEGDIRSQCREKGISGV